MPGLARTATEADLPTTWQTRTKPRLLNRNEMHDHLLRCAPTAGWQVDTFTYQTCWRGIWEARPTEVYLASDRGGNIRSVSWKNWRDSTIFHGMWTRYQGQIDIYFNCRGPVRPDGEPHEMLHSWGSRDPGGTYNGQDSNCRPIRITYVRTQTVRLSSIGEVQYEDDIPNGEESPGADDRPFTHGSARWDQPPAPATRYERYGHGLISSYWE